VEGNEPDVQPDVQGASRGKGDRSDPERAGAGGGRAEPGNEYAANAEAGEEGHRKQGSQNDTAAADLDPHEPPGQG
jgi:hypothetical protein